ncbi:MAG: hypothetical protein QM817_39595 [Archangium sp.]
MTAASNDPRVRWFHARRFTLRPGDAPELLRASGDSGFVAHLTACTQGATGWDWSFRLVKPGHGWAFLSDGKLTLFVDEPGQYVPAEAKSGDVVALRLPRARENLHPHRFSLYGGQGGCVVGKGYTKLFLPVTFEAAPHLVEACSSKWADQLRFSLYVANAPQDFERADSAIIDVGPDDEAGVVRVLEAFLRQYPAALVPRGIPYATQPGPLTLGRVEVKDKSDLCDGYGWRRADEAVRGVISSS